MTKTKEERLEELRRQSQTAGIDFLAMAQNCEIELSIFGNAVYKEDDPLERAEMFAKLLGGKPQ